MTILVRPAETRFTTLAEGRTTYHSFSYGAHYDVSNMSFGPLIALNEEQLPPGTGYDEHRHADVLIVTWVLEGRLHHSDSLGNAEVLEPGSVAITNTGRGITHTEDADPEVGVRFLQFMLRSEDPEPWYQLEEPGAHLVLAGGAAFRCLRLSQETELPDAALADLFVVSGHVVIGDRELGPGDEARLTHEGDRRLLVEDPAEVAVWSFPEPA